MNTKLSAYEVKITDDGNYMKEKRYVVLAGTCAVAERKAVAQLRKDAGEMASRVMGIYVMSCVCLGEVVK